MISRIISGQRSADTLNYSFLIFLTAITVLFYRKINSAFLLVTLYSGLIFMQAVLQAVKNKSRFLRLTYDLIFPTISILVIFDSLEKIVHYINPQDIDVLLIKTDYMLFNGYPTVMLENIMSPFLTDILQIAYSSYYFLPVTLGIVLLVKKNNSSFDRALFLIMLCFYLSYVGYLLWPALGPRYSMNHLQNAELKGLFLAQPIQELLNRLEGVKRDAFPSGHTGIALTVLYLSYRFEKRLFMIFLPFVLGLIVSTVYLRYHYVVDVIAGVVLALITIVIGERLYDYSKKRLDTDR
jgi:membrane-associated phospholipid phosphatase